MNNQAALIADLQARLEKAEGLIKTQRTLIEHQDDRIAEIVACKSNIQGQLTAANNLIREYRAEIQELTTTNTIAKEVDIERYGKNRELTSEVAVLSEYLNRIKVSLNWGDVHDVKSIIAQATQFMKDKKIPFDTTRKFTPQVEGVYLVRSSLTDVGSLMKAKLVDGQVEMTTYSPSLTPAQELLVDKGYCPHCPDTELVGVRKGALTFKQCSKCLFIVYKEPKG